MDAKKIGPLKVHVRGGLDHQGKGDGPAILLCHGFGAPGDDLVSLSRIIAAGQETRWFFPEAPLETEIGPGMWGRAWWRIDLEKMMTALMRGDINAAMSRLDEVPEGMDAAREALEETIAVLEKQYSVKREKLILGGFSQGSMITTELVTHQKNPYAGLIVFSGTRIGGERWQEGLNALGNRLSVLMSHGRRDPLLPFGRAEALRDMMLAAGAKVTFVEHRGAHEIPPSAVEAASAFARKQLAG